MINSVAGPRDRQRRQEGFDLGLHLSCCVLEVGLEFGEDFLLRRHDYHVDITGGFPVAQYVGDIVSVDGMRFPTKRRAYMRAPDLKPVRDLLLVALGVITAGRSPARWACAAAVPS